MLTPSCCQIPIQTVVGAAGYLHMIHQMKELITKAGKKAYTFVMGRPNPAKLANFPEASDFTRLNGLIYFFTSQIVMRMLNPFLHFCSVMFSFMFLAHKQLYWIVKSS